MKFLVVAAHEYQDIHSIDTKTTYLYSDLNEEIKESEKKGVLARSSQQGMENNPGMRIRRGLPPESPYRESRL